MKCSHFLLSISNKNSNNPDSELARLVNKGDGEGALPTNAFSRKVLSLCLIQGTDNHKELVSTLPYLL